MEKEIMELREEISLLTRKVEILERKENNRKAFGYVKILAKGIMIAALAFGAYWGYKYVVNELPNIIVEKVKDLNPLSGILKK